MPRSFEEYIGQLKELEQADNRAALYSFCTLNEHVLSFFKGIWGPLQILLGSSSCGPEVIEELKPALSRLSEIRNKYEYLKLNAKVYCKEDIIRFQEEIDAMSVLTVNKVWEALLALELYNESPVLYNINTRGSDSEQSLAEEASQDNKKTRRIANKTDGKKAKKRKVWFNLVQSSMGDYRYDIQVYLNGTCLGILDCFGYVPIEDVMKKQTIEVVYKGVKKKKWIINGLNDRRVYVFMVIPSFSLFSSCPKIQLFDDPLLKQPIRPE